ncbi:MAG: hypothetical protein RBS07_15115 [Lentimicrobium sp.]|jgi:hypothetical protein|nr:hypothetical protein [Lentimicrobium sp.]
MEVIVKKLLIVLFVLFLGGCMQVEADQPQPQISEDEYRDLIERMSELEEELGNLKQDIADGQYCYIYDCDGDE